MEFKSLFDQFPITPHTALIVVDIQNDFLPGGSLEVPHGDEIIPDVNVLMQNFFKHQAPVILTQDWHPRGHLSFASAYPDKNPGDPISAVGLGPIVWPDHCVQNTQGAALAENLHTNLGTTIIRKGYHPKVDSYSGFMDNDKQTHTGLAGLLQNLKIKTVFICGLALDYCVYFTAMDARELGFQVIFLKDLTRGIDQPEGNIQRTILAMMEHQIHLWSES